MAKEVTPDHEIYHKNDVENFRIGPHSNKGELCLFYYKLEY